MIAECVTDFVNYLNYEKHFSKHTVTAYQNDLFQFQKFISENFDTDEIKIINHQMIRSWLVQLMNDKISARSVARKLTTLKTFYRFLLKENIVESSPMAKVQSPKIQKRLPVFVEETPMNILLDNIEFENNFEGVRDKLIINILYSTGIRLSELIGLKKLDVDSYNQQIKVLGKRNKERIIPITKELSDQIILYNQIKADEGFDNENLLVTSKGENYIQNWFTPSLKKI